MEKQANDMRKVTVKVPDSKYIFFLELLAQLGIEATDDLEIPEEHKAIVLERMRLSQENPERLLKWDDVKDDFRLK